MAIRYIPDELVLIIHQDQIRRYGGKPGVRDKNLLSSALAQPKMSAGGRHIHRTIFEKAATYGYHVCRNHAFVGGNKRVSFVLMLVFLERNGWELRVTDEEAYSAMMELASGTITKRNLARWLKEHSIKLKA